MTDQTISPDTTDDADGSEMLSCQVCGSDRIDRVHWDAPLGVNVVAATCGDQCAATLESRRGEDGVLRLTVEVPLEEPFALDSEEYNGAPIEAVQYVETAEGITQRIPARIGVEYQHDHLCYEVRLETYDGSIAVSIEVGAFLAMCRRMTGDPDQENDQDIRPAPGAETYGEPFQTDSDAFGDWDVLYADLDADGADGPIVLTARFAVGYDSRRHMYSAIAEDAENHAIVVWFDDDEWISLCGNLLGN